MLNRYVIALNRLKMAERQLAKRQKQGIKSSLSIIEVAEIMDIVRKYPSKKIEHENLFTCGFSKN
ncbi:hypothetical protein [Brumimicrobium aurantiacum]|nr:hypothetical protein [Brumimicrobium aurantiacum]